VSRPSRESHLEMCESMGSEGLLDTPAVSSEDKAGNPTVSVASPESAEGEFPDAPGISSVQV
jgi:hypothetical protein